MKNISETDHPNLSNQNDEPDSNIEIESTPNSNIINETQKLLKPHYKYNNTSHDLNSDFVATTEMTVDELLDKIGFTRYHFIIILIVILSLNSDGVEIQLIYLIGPILLYINNYSENFLPQITSILFCGMAFGCIISGVITKYIGRKNAIMFFLTTILIFGTFCFMINNIYWFFICRFIVGISIGYLVNIVNALYEILPLKYRDFITGSIYISFKIGNVYFISIFYIFSIYTDVLNTYKYIVIVSSLPMFLCLVLAIFFYDESPRIFLWRCEYDKAWEIFDKMNKSNDGYSLVEEEKKKVVKYIENCLEKEYDDLIKDIKKNEIEEIDNVSCSEKENSLNLKEKMSLERKREFILENKKSWRYFSDIFRGKKLILTIILCLLWSLSILNSYVNSYSIPIILSNRKNIMDIENTTLEKDIQNQQKNVTKNVNSNTLIFYQKETILKLLISNIIPIPAEIFAGLLVIKSEYSKKLVIFFGFFFMGISSICMILFPDYIHLFSGGISVFCVFSFNITRVFTLLAYHTDNRDFAYGIANFTSRIMAIISPFVSIYFLKLSNYATCYVIMSSSILGCFISLFLNDSLSLKPLK